MKKKRPSERVSKQAKDTNGERERDGSGGREVKSKRCREQIDENVWCRQHTTIMRRRDGEKKRHARETVSISP